MECTRKFIEQSKSAIAIMRKDRRKENASNADLLKIVGSIWVNADEK